VLKKNKGNKCFTCRSVDASIEIPEGEESDKRCGLGFSEGFENNYSFIMNEL
jgi:hypothetical protein